MSWNSVDYRGDLMKPAVIGLCLAVGLSLAAPSGRAEASDGVCLGRVAGVGDRYNPATGSGFLALRAGPSTSAKQLGELLEGERLAITNRKGSWLYVITGGQGQGWVHTKYVRSSCK